MSAEVFNHAAARLALIAGEKYPDTCTIETENMVSDGAGGFIPGTPTNTYTGIRCCYLPFSGNTTDASGKMITFTGYKVEIPVIQNGSRVDIDTTTQRIIVDARGSEPAKTFRIDAPPDHQGIVYTIYATKEN